MSLHRDLAEKTYRHGPYQSFRINDPKPRHIHKASVRDRLIHHAIYRKLYPFFDRFFIHDSYSCREGKGTHRAINQFRRFAWKVSKNNTRTAWVLKCDIRRFFASISHHVLIDILRKHISDKDTLWLLEEIIGSFAVGDGQSFGLPLGNLTSQLFVNIYMNAFDQFVKRSLKVRHYIRYADDFVLFHQNRTYLENLLPHMSEFLEKELRLSLHPRKITIKTLSSGMDFLGWVHFPDHRVLRTTTKRRMFRRLSESYTDESVASYLGLLKHGNTYKLKTKVIESL